MAERTEIMPASRTVSFHRWIRRLALVATGFLTLVVAALALLQLPAVATWAVRQLFTFVPLRSGYALAVGRVSGDWVHALQLEDVRLRRGERTLAVVERLSLAYDPRQLLGAAPRTLREVVVSGARVVARREQAGWDIVQALRPSADTGQGQAFAVGRVAIREAQLAAYLAPDSAVRVRSLDLAGRDLVLAKQALFTIDRFDAAVAPPGSGRFFGGTARGALTSTTLRLDSVRIQTERSRIAARAVLPRGLDQPRLLDRLDVRFKAAPLALADLAELVPTVQPEGVVHLEAAARGAGRLVTATLAARLGASRPGAERDGTDGGRAIEAATIDIEGSATVAMAGGTAAAHDQPPRYRLHATVRRLDPARLLRAAPAGNIDGTADLDVRGRTLDEMEGRVALRLGASRIGGAAVRRLQLDAGLAAGRADITARGELAPGTVRAAGWIRPFDSLPTYRVGGWAVGLRGSGAVARALSGIEGAPALALRFRLAGAGITPSTVNGSGVVELAAVPGSELPGSTVPASTMPAGAMAADAVPAGTVPPNAAPVGEGPVNAEPLPLGYVRLMLEGRRLEARPALLIRGGRMAGLASVDLGDTVIVRVRRATFTAAELGHVLGRADSIGPVGLAVTGRGRLIPERRTAALWLAVEPSRVGPIELSGGTVAARLEGDTVVYSTSLQAPGGALALEGTARPTADARRPAADAPSLTVRRGRIDSLDLGRLLGRTDLATDLNARFTASAAGMSLDDLRARLGIDLGPSRVNGTELARGRGALALEGAALRGTVAVRGPDAAIDVHVSGRKLRRRDADRTALTARGTARLERLARWTGGRLGGGLDGHVESRFALDALADSAGLLTLGGTITAAGGLGDVRLDPLHLVLRPDPGAIRVDTLILRSNVAALDGAGSVALRERAGVDTLTIAGPVLDAVPLAGFLGSDTVSFDSARVAVAVAGPASRRRVHARFDAHQILVANNLAGRVMLDATATIADARRPAFAGRLRVADVVAGQVRITEARVAARYDSAVALSATATVQDSIRFVTVAHGVASPETTQVRLERLELADWSLERPATLTLRPQLVVDGFALHAGAQPGRRRILVDGALDRHAPSDLTVRLDQVDLDLLGQLGLLSVPGRLDGWLHLAGTADAPTVEGKLALAVEDEAGEEIGGIRTNLSWTESGLMLDAVAAAREGGRLTVEGRVPIRFALTPADTVAFARGASDSVALAVRSDTFDLAFFQPLLPPETASGLQGALAVDARIGGTLDAPQAGGTLAVAGAGVTIPTIGVTYERGALSARLDGDRILVERAQLFTGDDDSLTARGTVRLRPLHDPGLAFTADLHDFQIASFERLKATASGQVKLAGTVTKPTLGGSLRLGPTEVSVGAEMATAQVEKVELTPADVRQLVRDFGPASIEEAREEPGLVERVRLDLALELPGRVWLRRRANPSFDIELAGTMRLRQEPGGEMRFLGQVEPVAGRSTIDLSGREFRFTGGGILLNGPVDSTRLDVTAEYQVPVQTGIDDEGVIVTVTAVGRPDSLGLKFASDPTMSQEDILSYIVTGRPASDNPLAGTATQGGNIGESLAFGTVAGAISSRVGAELGFDVFQIRQDGTRGLTLTAGRYLGPSVFLNFQLPLELGDAQRDPGATLGPGFELDYTVNRWLRAGLRGGSLSPGFRLSGRHAY